MKISLLIAAALIVFFFGAKIARSACDDAVSKLALDALYDRFNGVPTGIDVFMSGDYEPANWKDRFDLYEKRIATTAAWARTLKDPCVRDAYLHWLDLYERSLNEAREELRTKRKKKDMEAWHERQARDDAAKCEYERQHGAIPKPKDE